MIMRASSSVLGARCDVTGCEPERGAGSPRLLKAGAICGRLWVRPPRTRSAAPRAAGVSTQLSS